MNDNLKILLNMYVSFRFSVYRFIVCNIIILNKSWIVNRNIQQKLGFYYLHKFKGLNMVNTTKLKDLAKSKGIKISFLCEQFGLHRSYINNIERGKATMSDERIHKIAQILNTTYEYLTDQTDDPKPKNKKTPEITSNADIISDSNNIYMIPLFENVSAGFGAYADDHITDYIPMYFSNPVEADESIFVTVRGDSMFPKIENGDSVLVHKQKSVDSGTIAVVLLDEDEALVKKIVYGADWIELHSINPMYPTMRFEGADVLRIQVLGAVKKIIKNV